MLSFLKIWIFPNEDTSPIPIIIFQKFPEKNLEKFSQNISEEMVFRELSTCNNSSIVQLY